MQIWKDWAPKQDPAMYGTLDEATIEHINEHFYYREICDDERMYRFFSRAVAEATEQYYNIARIQKGNATFQPHINRYGEFLKVISDRESRVGTSSGSTKKGTRASGRKNRTENWTKNDEYDEIGTESGTMNRQSSENVSDRKTVNRTSGNNNTQTTGPYTETVTTGSTETTKYDSEKESVQLQDKKRTTTKDGKITEHTTADGTKNYEKDATGSKETTTHVINTGTTTKQLGTKVITEESKAATSGKKAEKAAPMSAVGIQRTIDSGKDAYNQVRNGSITSLDFEYASGYGETAGETGTTGERREHYEGDEGIVSTTGNKTDNQDETTYARNVQKAQDVTKETDYGKYTETETESGGETRTKTGGHTVGVSGNETRSISQKIIKDEGTGTESGTDVLTGDRRGTESGTDTRNDTKTGTRKGTDEGFVTDNDNRQEDVTGSSSTEKTDTTTADRIATNRYTGRDGLTPHDAMKGAIQYLMDYPPCIKWLIQQLEPCFIQVFDI